MARFLFRSAISTVVTMLLVSVSLFYLIEVGSGDITVKLLGIESTPEQRESYRAQLGLNRPLWLRYSDWLIGNDWYMTREIGLPLITLPNPSTKELEWWADVEGIPTQWEIQEEVLFARQRQADGSTISVPDDERWTINEKGEEEFWGLNNNNSAVRWIRGSTEEVYIMSKAGGRWVGDGPREFIPLVRGLIRGDAGESLETGRPVSSTLPGRFRNTAILAAVAFLVVMPLALFFGIIAGTNEGRLADRIISLLGLSATATPDFIIGILMILIFGIWLRWLPPVSLFLSENTIFTDPKVLILPVITLTAVEFGYVARITRASMVEVINSPYIRAAILKGMPYWRVVIYHAIRNALMAPITVIMLHVNWLISGIVVVEVVFGFPGLGEYIYGAAIFGDFNAVEAATMFTVIIAISTRLLGDLIYTFLNPRIRYA